MRLPVAPTALLSLLPALLSLLLASTCWADPGTWQHKGVALGLFAEERDFDYGPLIEEIAGTGATHISIVVPYYQDRVDSVRIGPHPRFSPSMLAVQKTLGQARQAGLQVLLFPILRLTHKATPDEWRGAIAPKDPKLWWRSYQAFILEFARLAKKHRAVALCVGSELESMDGDPKPWRPLIARVRRVFKGKLVYSANWWQFERTAIWKLVDVAGISAYFWLVGKDEKSPSLERLIHGWRECRVRVARWWVRVRKPLIFTEFGYRSAVGTAANPWVESTRHPVDLQAQIDAYRAFHRVWRQADFFHGVYVWNWFGWGGPKSSEFTPRGKPAVTEICRWYGTPAERCPRAYGMPWEPLYRAAAAKSTSPRGR